MLNVMMIAGVLPHNLLSHKQLSIDHSDPSVSMEEEYRIAYCLLMFPADILIVDLLMLLHPTN